MQFFLFHSLSARSLQNKASFSCTQSGTTSTSLPGHPILCIPSYWDVQLVTGYTEVRTVLWVSCGLDQLSHHISIGTILVTAVHRDENGSTGLYVLPHKRNYIPSSIFMEVTPRCSQALTSRRCCCPSSYTSGKHKPCAVGCFAPYSGQIYLACLGFTFFLIH